MKKELFLHFSNAFDSANCARLLFVAGVFFSSLLTNGLYAQTGVITGNVSDSTGPLRGVSVVVKGTATGATTDSMGNYSIHASGKSVLVFSLVNYDKLSINVNNRGMVNIILHANNRTLGEVVVIGYGTQKKANVTGAVSSIKGDALTLVPASNLSNVLAGRLAGVYVSQSTGVPGISSDIRVRSSSSWNSSPALMVIDGVVRDKDAFDALNANDIDNITVLKDGASASIYGARSSNGVILVTTKRGRKARPVLTYNGTYLMQKPITKGATLLPAGKSAELNNLYAKAALGYDWFGQDEVDYLKAHGGYNYLDYAYVTPSTVDNALNVSGGTDGVKYFIGGDVMHENGFLKALNFHKYNLRASLDVSITDNLTASMQLSSTYSERQTANFGGTDDLSAMYGKLSQFFFYVPPYIDGHLVNPGWIGNPIGLINNSGYVRSNRRGLDGLVSLNYNIPFVKGLSARVAYSRNDVNNGGKTYQIQHTLYNYKTTGSRQHIYTDTLLSISKAPYPGVPFLGVNNATQGSYQFNAQLSYQRDLGKHHIEATVLSEIFEEKDNSDNLTRYNFPVITTDQFFATSADRANSDGNGSESTIGRSSYFGRVNYQYGDKYLFAASLRADGSMIFAPNHRWGYFPSVSAGWKISNEEFFKKGLGDIFSLVKLRASLGLTGNDAVAPWQWQERYTSAGNAFFGNALQPVIAYGGVVNPNLTWEKSRSTNFGLDVVTAFDLSVSLNYWHRHTYDILGSRIVRMPTTFGGALPAENYGQVNSQGYELELGYKGHAGAIDYSVNGNFAFATTKVIQQDFAPGGLAVDNPNGKPIGYTSGLISTGIIRQQSQLDALPSGYTIYGAKPVLGDLNYQDISGIGGKPDGKIDDYDRQIISNYSQGTAPYTAGLNMSVAWKGISINAFFQSAFGYPKLYNDNWGRGFPLDASVNTWWGDMWTPDNPNGSIPRFQGPGEPNSGMASSFWYDKGGYVRLKTLSLGYDLPAKWLSRIKVQRVSVNVTGTNVFFLSQFKWYDPEISSLASYPNMKTLNIGLNVTL